MYAYNMYLYVVIFAVSAHDISVESAELCRICSSDLLLCISELALTWKAKKTIACNDDACLHMHSLFCK